MKITIVEPKPDEEDEIIVKCSFIDESLAHFLNQVKNGSSKINCCRENRIILVEKKDILFFESVDDKVFAYTQNDALETKFKLYEIEEIMDPRAFFRANKAVIVNLAKIQSLSPAFGGRFEAVLENGYKVIVSRNYVPKLKELLGL